MSLTEACAFLKMRRSTMYYHRENGNIPATRKGKNYILFKDELVRWAESGRTNDVPMTISERKPFQMVYCRHTFMGHIGNKL